MFLLLLQSTENAKDFSNGFNKWGSKNRTFPRRWLADARGFLIIRNDKLGIRNLVVDLPMLNGIHFKISKKSFKNSDTKHIFALAFKKAVAKTDLRNRIW